MATPDENKEQSDSMDPDSEHSSGTTSGGAAQTPQGASAGDGSVNMEFVLDIPLEVTVELGRTKMLINDLLKLGQGSVIELTKLAGESLEILANQKPIARGEVVVVNEKYGIRLTEVISPMERIERLR
ncbi:Flagellar motor switch protein FliN [Olavius sp. associated proteobacterium Delta 1]|nr:Flagellar motor switch protein FliN [Olavius sp. associated proteobacterium Delta 1]